MSKDKRRGARKDRRKKFGSREPELGYYLIVTDAKETEKHYFEGIRDTIPVELRGRLVIKVERAATVDLVKRAVELRNTDPQYRIPWIVFDRDQVKDFDGIVRMAERVGVNAGWSNPCIEIWFFSYFKNIPNIDSSVTCCRDFGKEFERVTGLKYKKSNKDLYSKLVLFGDESKAIERAEKKMKYLVSQGLKNPSEMVSGNTVYELVRELHSKKEKVKQQNGFENSYNIEVLKKSIAQLEAGHSIDNEHIKDED